MNKIAAYLLWLIACFIFAYNGYAEGDPLRGFEKISPRVGEEAPDFTLKDPEGNRITLSQFRGDKPVLLEFGSYTCPIYRGKVNSSEKLYKRYQGKVAFFIIYTLEAHPKGSNSPYAAREWITPPNEFEGILFSQPQNYQERAQLAQICIKNLDVSIPVLIDEMDNDVWSAYGGAPNSAFLIDVQGRVVERQVWFNPHQMERR